MLVNESHHRRARQYYKSSMSRPAAQALYSYAAACRLYADNMKKWKCSMCRKAIKETAGGAGARKTLSESERRNNQDMEGDFYGEGSHLSFSRRRYKILKLASRAKSRPKLTRCCVVWRRHRRGYAI